MGLVYAPRAIEAGRIPEPGAHEAAGRFILDSFMNGQSSLSMEEMSCSSGIVSGMVYGSTAGGRASMRSDLDVLVVFDPFEAQRALPVITSTFAQAEGQYKVKVEPHITTLDSLYSDLRHTIDPLFAGHLLEVQQMDDPSWSFNSPLDPIATKTETDESQVRSLAIRYTSTKAKKFAEAHSTYRGEMDLKIYQRAFELPGAIGRKVIAAMKTDDEELPSLNFRPDILGIVMAKLIDHVDPRQANAVNHHSRLVDLDHEYDRLLEATIGGDITIASYSEWLERRYLEVCRMAFSVSNAWADIVSRQAHDLASSVELPVEAAD